MFLEHLLYTDITDATVTTSVVVPTFKGVLKSIQIKAGSK